MRSYAEKAAAFKALHERPGAFIIPNPWDAGTLEWATTSPPPEHNFDFLPPIRSERPVWDLAHREVVAK